MQLEIATSTRRYFPPSGTAGLERCWVRGKSRVPAPPPRITASRLCFAGICFQPTLNLESNARIDAKQVGFQGGEGKQRLVLVILRGLVIIEKLAVHPLRVRTAEPPIPSRPQSGRI